MRASPERSRAVAGVGDPAGFDAKPKVPAALGVLAPAELVAGGRELEGAWTLQRKVEATLELRTEPVEPAIGDGVLEAGVLALAAIAEVALRRHDRLGNGEQAVRREEADEVREPGVGLRVAVRRAETAAHRQVEAGEATGLDDGDEAEVLREDVDVIDRRHGDRRLELARQVVRAEDLLRFLGRRDLRAVEPDLVVGTGTRQQMSGELLGPGLRLGMRRRSCRTRAREDVAVDVAAGGDRVDQGRVHRRDRGLEVAFQHAVQLEGLARGQSQRAVGMTRRQRIERQPLRRRAVAAGQARADHEAERRFQLCVATRVDTVAVVLLVGTVELQQVLVVLGDSAGHGVGEAFHDRAAQAPARGLDALDGARVRGAHQ